MKTRQANTITELAEILCDVFQTCGLSSRQALEKSQDAAEKLAHKFAGLQVYFPKINKRQRAQDEQIYAAHVFGGLSLSTVATHTNVTKAQAFRAVQRMRQMLGDKDRIKQK